MQPHKSEAFHANPYQEKGRSALMPTLIYSYVLLAGSVIADQIQFAISNLENFQVFLIAFCKHSFGY